jgi:hypothetical protein
MSKRSVIVLMCHRHKLLEIILDKRQEVAVNFRGDSEGSSDQEELLQVLAMKLVDCLRHL